MRWEFITVGRPTGEALRVTSVVRRACVAGGADSARTVDTVTVLDAHGLHDRHGEDVREDPDDQSGNGHVE